MPVEEIPVAEALRREPRVNPGISRAFEVQDASIDAWKLLWGNAALGGGDGAEILTYHWVTEILRDGDRVAGAVARDDRGGGETRSRPDSRSTPAESGPASWPTWPAAPGSGWSRARGS